jgi:hypothetical protein
MFHYYSQTLRSLTEIKINFVCANFAYVLYCNNLVVFRNCLDWTQKELIFWTETALFASLKIIIRLLPPYLSGTNRMTKKY